MQSYARYILKSLIIPVLVITITLTMVVWLTQSVRFIDMIINRGLGIGSFLYLSLLLIPSLVSVILPIALFVSIVFVYNRLTMSSELIVLQGAGLSKVALAKPALIIGTAATILGYILSLYLMPISNRELKDLQVYIRDNYAAVMMQEGVFNSPIPGLTLYIQEKQDDGLMKGILIHDERDPDKAVTLMAKEGRLVQTPNGLSFDLTKGNRQSVNQKQDQLSLLYFDQYTLDLSMLTKTSATRWREPQERFINELFIPDKDQPQMTPKLRAEGHQRITWPLYNALLTMVALIAMFSGSFNRRGQWKRIITSTVIAIMLLVFSIALHNAVANKQNLEMIVYINIFAWLFAAIVFFLKPDIKKRKS